MRSVKRGAQRVGWLPCHPTQGRSAGAMGVSPPAVMNAFLRSAPSATLEASVKVTVMIEPDITAEIQVDDGYSPDMAEDLMTRCVVGAVATRVASQTLEQQESTT